MNRGEVWWAQLPGLKGRRPVLLLTRTAVIGYRTSVTVAPLTRTIREIRSHVRLGANDGVPKESAVNLDDLQTIAKKRLVRHVTTLSRSRMQQVDEAIRFALALPPFQKDAP
ncbi:MAG: type II toxin-antitoxin system PemK/MazF family toxin [Chloroflexi bacterium]|nr:type II toxin-antitoxin system PemK/MazF family toxin [Chloroflexota bacterium]